MFGLFQRRKSPLEDFGFLGMDMHAHWLPGIDDGAATLADSMEMLRHFTQLGYKRLIATPHVMADLYPNTPRTIRAALAQVKEAARSEGLTIELEAAAEYLMDANFVSLLEADDLLLLPGRRVLVEYSFFAPPPQRHDILFQLQARGYQPVLAHPERYRYFHGDMDEFELYRDRGIELQLNVGSLSGSYGKGVKKVAITMLTNSLYSWLGSDAHHLEHLQQMEATVRDPRVGKLLANEKWLNQQLGGASSKNGIA